MNKLMLTLLSGALVLTGCGDTTQPPQSPTAAAMDITGAWNSDCLDQGDGTFARLAFHIGVDIWALDYLVHGDEECTAELVEIHIEGPYTLEGASTAVENAHDARFGFTKKSMTPRADALVEALDGAGCGGAPWERDVAQDVSAGCTAFGQYPLADCSADYDLVRRDGDSLSFGQRPKDNDMCSPEKRPTALAPFSVTRTN